MNMHTSYFCYNTERLVYLSVSGEFFDGVRIVSQVTFVSDEYDWNVWTKMFHFGHPKTETKQF